MGVGQPSRTKPWRDGGAVCILASPIFPRIYQPEAPVSEFWSRIHKGRLFQVLAVYLGASWLVFQVSHTLTEALALPDWVTPAAVLLLLAGLVVVLATAWIQSHPLVKEREAADQVPRAWELDLSDVRAALRHRRLPHLTWARALGGGAAVFLLLFGLAGAYVVVPAYLGLSATAEPDSPEIRSLAVLPFVDMSPAADQEYFSDGISEELLNLLARLPDLQVAARTSSFAFKGRNEQVAEIGRQLNVGAVLEGSVRRDGDRIRVTAQLIDARSGYHLWSENYDRHASGVLALQDDIARAIVSAIRLRLAGGGGDAAALLTDHGARPTVDPETHTLYLRGLHHWHRRRIPDFHLSIDYFQQAIARDPGFAPAHAGLALSQITLTGYDNSTVDTMSPAARAAAERALELDATLPDAFAALGLTARREGDWAAAEQHYRRALQLSPNHLTAHHWLSQHLVAMGQFDESLALAQRALELDPLSLIINNNLGFIHQFRGEIEQAARAYEATIELDPSFPTGLSNLWGAYQRLGRFDDALAVLDRLEATGARPGVDALRTYTEGLRDPARRGPALAALQEVARRPDSNTWNLAVMYAMIGELDAALDVLERAYAERHYNLPYLAIMPQLQPLHGHPRYEALVRELGLEGVPRRP
jgi:adenylate cyclase